LARKPKLKIIPLGGLGEVGKNMMVMEYGSDMLLIDAGLMFPEEEMLGIDLVLPDFTYVRKNRDKLRAIVITHGHEDHTGALPFLLKDVNAPVYGTRLTLGLIKNKLSEHHLKKVKLKEIKAGQKVDLGVFRVKFVHVSHSVPDGVGLIIETPMGVIVHSGDFKFDQTPVDGRVTDFREFAMIGEKRVLALLSDSTNAETAGFTLPEKTVGDKLDEIFKGARGRIIVASFASHIHRIQQVVDVAHKNNRKIAIVGRSMVENANIAAQLGYLHIPEELMVNPRDIGEFPRDKIVILSTGSQGEPLSALSKMASRDHKWVQIEPGDTVVISATPVPGNETAVYRTINQLFKRGGNVFYESISGVHVSGHAAQEELKLMMNLVRPRYFIPIHGEYRHLEHHARIAEELGISRENIFILENGDVVEFDKKGARVNGRVAAGAVFVDGLGVGDIGDVVLRDRHQLSRDGIFIVVLTVDQHSGEIVAGPDIISRGFVYMKEAGELIGEARERVKRSFEESAKAEVTDWAVLRNHVRDVMSKFLYEKTRRRPMIMPIIMEV
jgi:ribonuclease J